MLLVVKFGLICINLLYIASVPKSLPKTTSKPCLCSRALAATVGYAQIRGAGAPQKQFSASTAAKPQIAWIKPRWGLCHEDIRPTWRFCQQCDVRVFQPPSNTGVTAKPCGVSLAKFRSGHQKPITSSWQASEECKLMNWKMKFYFPITRLSYFYISINSA